MRFAILAEPFTWTYAQVQPRISHAGTAALSAYNTTLFAVQAVVASACYLASLGTNQEILTIHKYNERTLNSCIPSAYLCFLKIFNPSVENHFQLPTEENLQSHWVNLSTTAVALRHPAAEQAKWMNFLKNSKEFSYHITRIAAPLSAIALVVYATARMVLGTLAAALSCACFGTVPALNKWAWENLANGGFILTQLQNGLLGIIRPDLV